MIKSIKTTEQDDLFDFLREDEPVGHDWMMKGPAESQTNISVDPLLHSFSQNNPDQKKSDTFS